MVKTETPQAEIDWLAEDFNLKGTDGKYYDLAKTRGPNGLVVVFMCNHCPYVQTILNKIIRDAADLKVYGIYTVGIMPNDTTSYPEDSFENMAKLHKKAQLPFPYLIDEEQSVAKKYKAVCTPDFYGFDANLELQYRGRLDSSGNSSNLDAKRELYEAMMAVAQSGKAPKTQYPSIGCSIKWR
ncbi:thioredoxin family protein [Rickettsiales bacterium]|nr:thioredoxin family protein [Rickettsiales bacterium]